MYMNVKLNRDTVAANPKSVDPTENRFQADAYAFKDDVTAEAVDILREKAQKSLGEQELDHIDGFGRIFRT